MRIQTRNNHRSNLKKQNSIRFITKQKSTRGIQIKLRKSEMGPKRTQHNIGKTSIGCNRNNNHPKHMKTYCNNSTTK